MNARRSLPVHLQNATFTRADLDMLGVPGQRLRARDVVPVGRGYYRIAGRTDAPWADVGRETPGHGLDVHDLRSLLQLTRDTVLSHHTAAHLHGLPVPGWVTADPRVHLTMPRGSGRVRRPETVSHRRPWQPRDQTTVFELATTSAERTWLDLSSLTPRMTRDDLVVAADFLVNRPWLSGVGRIEPITTITALTAAVHRSGRFIGITAAKGALALVRVGADSPPETKARLAFVDAGLPEPQLQVPADPTDPHSPMTDLGYVEWRIAMQYEGAHHRDEEQQAKDAARDLWFQMRDWLVIKMTVADLRDGFRRPIRRVRERLAEPPQRSQRFRGHFA